MYSDFLFETIFLNQISDLSKVFVLVFRITFWKGSVVMARIIEGKRRIIKMSTDDVLSIVREYQQITHNACCYEHIRELQDNSEFFIPEET